jgi:spore germination protein GerM
MAQRRPLLLLLLAALAVILAVIFFTGGGGEILRPAARPAEPRPPEPDAPAAAAPAKRTVTLFFLREADDLLAPEEREIVSDPSPAREAAAILAELISGSSSGGVPVLPPETKLGQVYVTRDGTAYVDLSRDFVDLHPSGSSAEIASVYALVNSLAFNLKTVKKVFFLVEGEERETLAGHIGLGRPFLPDFRRNAK